MISSRLDTNSRFEHVLPSFVKFPRNPFFTRPITP